MEGEALLMAFRSTGLALAAATALLPAMTATASAQTATAPAPAAAAAPSTTVPGLGAMPEVRGDGRPSIGLPAGTSLPEPDPPGIQIPGTGLTIAGLAAAGTDYLFRGISQTRNNWAFQSSFDLSHESGVYIGGFISNAKFLADPWNNTRQELDAQAGYRFTVGAVNLDLGWVGYFYPGQTKAPGTQLNEFWEISLKANYTWDKVKFLAAFNYSPNWFGRSGNAYYIEGGADVTLPFEITGAVRVGYQWIQRNFALDGYRYFGTPDYLWYSVGISREIIPNTGITATLAWYGTNISKSECIPVVARAEGGQRLCEGRVLFTISKTF